MTPVRTTARGLLLTVIGLLLSAGAASASPSGQVPRLVFPILGTTTFTDDFTSPRFNGRHGATDLMAARGLVAVAAEAGRVKFWTTSASAGCMLYLEGDSGHEYLYIHLNNDKGSGNDNRGKCVAGGAYAPGLASGDRVAAGEPVGYVGDSGNADGNPQLHFEVTAADGSSINPYPHLLKARRLLFSAQPGSTFTLALTGKVANAAGEELQVTVDQVRQWPGGRRVKQPGQKVPVTVPETASIEGLGGATASLEPYPALELLTKGLPVTVWTSPAKVTTAALFGTKGGLAAARVVVNQ